jgi:hypothetical protein
MDRVIVDISDDVASLRASCASAFSTLPAGGTVEVPSCTRSAELPAILTLLGFIGVDAASSGTITAQKPAWASSGGAPLRRRLPAPSAAPTEEGKVEGVVLVPGAAAAAAWAALAAGGGGATVDEEALLRAAPAPASAAGDGDAGCAPTRKACANCSCGCVPLRPPATTARQPFTPAPAPTHTHTHTNTTTKTLRAAGKKRRRQRRLVRPRWCCSLAPRRCPRRALAETALRATRSGAQAAPTWESPHLSPAQTAL